MKFTHDFAIERFRYFNESIFQGALTEPPIILCRVKTFLGKCTYKIKRRIFGKPEYYDFKLRFNEQIDLSRQELEDIIIHEMIHYYIESHHLKDSSAHGQIFQKMMKDINERFNRHIAITYHLTNEQRDALSDQQHTQKVVAVITFKTGKRGIKVLPTDQKKILKYCRTIEAAKTIRSVDLYLTDHPCFNRYPKSAAFNVFNIDDATLEQALETAQSLPWKTK